MRKTVLVVEDEFLIAIDLKLLLESRGWEVLGPAATVSDALLLLGDELPEVTSNACTEGPIPVPQVDVLAKL